MPDLDRLLRDRLAAETAASATPARALDDVRTTARRRRTRHRALGAAAVVVVVAGVLGAAVVTQHDAPAPTAADPTTSAPVTAPAASAATRHGAVGYDPATSAVSCVEDYSPRGVTRRGFAFDGVVTAIGDSVSTGGGYAPVAGLAGVTFDVRHWYAGGSGETDTETDTVTVDLGPPGAGGEDTSDSAYGIGTRILVSGESLARHSTGPLDHPYAWGCGFTRYWDEPTAAAWDEAFAR